MLWCNQQHGCEPWMFLNSLRMEPNALICDLCYFDSPPDNNMGLCHEFSKQNVFGPVMSHDVNSINPNVQKAIQLWASLSACATIEEAVIQQITPLVSTLKLAQGNIGTKGNTCCLWTNSKINTALPNLPSQCKHTILKHSHTRNANVQDIASMKFERQKIIDLLHLLQQIGGI